MRPAPALLLAVTVNSAAVAVQGRHRLLSRGFGRRAWLVHAGLILPGWLGLAWALASARPAPRPGPGWRALGWGLEAAGLTLVGLGFRALGLGAAVNADLFRTGPRPPVRARAGAVPGVRDPIYLGYAALLAGRSLRRGAPGLLVALEALLLLTVEARIEDWAAARLGHRG